MWWFCSPPLGLHVKSTLPWPLCCQHASPAKRKRLSRDYRTTIRNNRRQNQEKHKSKACTVKSCCCSVAPLSSALRNYEPNATSRRLRWKPEVKKTNPVLRLQTDVSFIETKPVCEYFYCNKVCCHLVVNIMLIVIVCFGWFFGCFNSLYLNIVTLLQLYKKKINLHNYYYFFFREKKRRCQTKMFWSQFV